MLNHPCQRGLSFLVVSFPLFSYLSTSQLPAPPEGAGAELCGETERKSQSGGPRFPTSVPWAHYRAATPSQLGHVKWWTGPHTCAYSSTCNPTAHTCVRASTLLAQLSSPPPSLGTTEPDCPPGAKGISGFSLHPWGLVTFPPPMRKASPPPLFSDPVPIGGRRAGRRPLRRIRSPGQGARLHPCSLYGQSTSC